MKLFILAAFSLWTLALVGYQIRTVAWQRFARRAIFLPFLPCYRLFFSEPRSQTLSFRDRRADGTLTTWHAVPILGPHRWHHALWHPGLVRGRPVSVSVNLLVAAADLSDARLQSHANKLEMLREYVHRFLIRNHPPDESTVGRQFKIEQGPGLEDQAPLVYESTFLNVSPPEATR